MERFHFYGGSQIQGDGGADCAGRSRGCFRGQTPGPISPLQDEEASEEAVEEAGEERKEVKPLEGQTERQSRLEGLKEEESQGGVMRIHEGEFFSMEALLLPAGCSLPLLDNEELMVVFKVSTRNHRTIMLCKVWLRMPRIMLTRGVSGGGRRCRGPVLRAGGDLRSAPGRGAQG